MFQIPLLLLSHRYNKTITALIFPLNLLSKNKIPEDNKTSRILSVDNKNVLSVTLFFQQHFEFLILAQNPLAVL